MSDRLDEIRALLADVKRGAVFPSCERADTDMRWLVAEVERTQADLAAARTVLDGAYRLPRGTSLTTPSTCASTEPHGWCGRRGGVVTTYGKRIM